MRKKILIVNPPVFTPKPWNNVENGSMGPYVLASFLKASGEEVALFIHGGCFSGRKECG